MYICIFWINWIMASHLTEQPPTASLSHCFLYSLPTPMDSNGSYRALMKKAMLLGQKENFFDITVLFIMMIDDDGRFFVVCEHNVKSVFTQKF